MKRVAAVHDLCGFGKASLNTIVPILSSMGVQVCALPTAVLSTHTGGYEGFAFEDLTEYMGKHIEHWKKLNLDFDCIYTGYLGSYKQVELIKDFIEYFERKDNLVLIDPVMGDDGELYSSITEDMVREMRELIAHGDIITPNVTEAQMLLNIEYKGCRNIAEWKEILIKLSKLGAKKVVLTSAKEEGNDKVLTLAYDREEERFYKIENPHVDISFPGTGDTFASLMVGYMLKEEGFKESLRKSCSFIYKMITESNGKVKDIREGLPLESFMRELIMEEFELLELFEI